MAQKRDTYKYELKQGNKVVYVGITDDPGRREQEHRNDGKQFTSMNIVGNREGYINREGYNIMLFPVKKEESASFFNLVNSLHEKTSVIITTNKAPTEWVQTLNDEVLATAIIDRLLYRREVIKLAGTSHRLENRKTIFPSESAVNGKQLRRAASTTIQTQQ